MTPRIQYKVVNEGCTPRGAKLPVGRIIGVWTVVMLPAEATHDQVLEWIAHEMGYGSISADNPLCEHGLELDFEPTLDDTGFTSDAVVRRREVFG